MKLSTKKSPAPKQAARKAVKPAAKTSARKQATSTVAAAPANAGSARAALEALAARESIDARTAVLVALVDMTGLVTVAPDGTISPFNLFNLTFDDPRVGLDDGQMRLLYGKVSTAIGEQRVDALIQKHLVSQASAAVVIFDVTDLIQLWIDNPSLTASNL